MKSFSTNLLFQLLAILMITSACATVSDFKQDTPYQTKEFTIEEPGNLQVKTSGGNIKVTSHEGNKVIVEMYVSKNGRSIDSSDAKAQKILEDYRIDISQSANTITATADGKSMGWLFGSNDASISFNVYVPRAMSCQLNTSGGTISIEGVAGEQDIRTSGGNLRVSNINGDVRAKTSGGTIQIENYKGALNAKTSGGTISLHNASGKLIVDTSGGSIRLNNVSGGIDAHTSGGSIDATILALTDALTLKTSGGSIHATLPAGLGLDLDLKGNKVNTVLANFDGEVEDDKVYGRINGGGIPVKLSTSGGSVSLEYQ